MGKSNCICDQGSRENKYLNHQWGKRKYQAFEN